MITVAIHQPNFFPWLGFFQKIARSDVFIFLDHVQYPKTGGVWCNRVKMRCGGEARWVTGPIKRAFHGVAAINEVEWADDQLWRSKLLKTLVANYSKAPYFKETIAWLEPLVLLPESNLSHYNMTVIKTIAAQLGLRHEHCLTSSTLGCQGAGSELLVSLTREVGGACYMCGGGASGYQKDRVFDQAKVLLAYQNFQHPVYHQVGATDFVPGLSVVDALMNVGRDGVGVLLAVE